MENNGKRSLHDRMIVDGEKELIEECIWSDNSLECVLAIGACVKHKIRTPKTTEALLRLRNSTKREFCCWISDLANAALDVLEIKKYQGNNKLVIEAIESQFDFVR